MLIETDFELRQIVYLKTDEEQLPRMVTSVEVACDMSVMYHLACGTQVSTHFGFEISPTQNELIKLGIDKSYQQQ